MWINGANQQVWVREEAIIKILSNEGCKGNIRKVFINLKRLCDNKSPLFTQSNKIYSQEDLDENDLYVIGDISSVEEEEGEVYCGWKTSDYSHILDRFIYKRSKFSNKIGLPIPVFYPTKPSNHTKFLLHILLSMGEFISEGELYSNAGSSIQLLKNADLLL